METRESKYTKYRKDLTGEKPDVLETPSTEDKEEEKRNRLNDTLSATSTLPIDEVMKSINDDEEEKEIKKQNKKQLIKIISIAAGLCVLATLIIVFAVIIF